MQEFIVIYNECDVVGYDNLSELQGALVDYNDKERLEKAREEGLDPLNMSLSELARLDQTPGDEPKVYKIAEVLEHLNNSGLHETDLEVLRKQLYKEKVSFQIDDTVLDAVLEDVDQYYGYF